MRQTLDKYDFRFVRKVRSIKKMTINNNLINKRKDNSMKSLKKMTI